MDLWLIMNSTGAATGKPTQTPSAPWMGEGRLTYSAAPDRAPLRWPGQARVALWVSPNIEHYEFLPEKIRVRNPWPRMPHPDILGYGLRDYGSRVGVWLS